MPTVRFTPAECRALSALGGLPEREDFWNSPYNEFQAIPFLALHLIGSSERRGWVWRLDNHHQEDGRRWWTVSVQQRVEGPIGMRTDKALCPTFEEAIARAALLALKPQQEGEGGE